MEADAFGNGAARPRDRGPAERGEALSALCDGEAAGLPLSALCEAWREDPQVRTQWADWHLIGDALRSEELVSQGGTSSDRFLSAFQARLAQEPVVLAPAPLADPQPAGRPAEHLVQVAEAGGARMRPRLRRLWAASSAVAAGFVAVAGVTVVVRDGALDGASSAGAVLASSQQVAPVATPAPAGSLVMVRNPQIDAYFNAHRQYTQSPVPASVGGLRQAVASPDAP